MAALPRATRSDAVTWLVGVIAGVGATAIADAAGARLGAALTLGLGILIAVVLAGVLMADRTAPGGAVPTNGATPPQR